MTRPGQRRVRRWRRLFWAVLAAVGLSSCSGVETLNFQTPPRISTPPVTPAPTFPAGLSAASEGAVGGATTTVPVAVGPGNSVLEGTVQGPSGPVSGATVEIDRFVGNATATAQTTTSGGGTFSFQSILGGRYRVRAWQAPTLALTSPQLLFLQGGQSQTLTLQVSAFSGPAIAMSIAPGRPTVGERDNLLLRVTTPVVGPTGVVDNPPISGVAVTLTEGPLWDVYNGNPLTTNAVGEILFKVSCQAAGADPLSAQVGSSSAASLPVPACSPAPIPTTTAATTTTTSISTTSTTCPPAATTTTSLPFGNAC